MSSCFLCYLYLGLGRVEKIICEACGKISDKFRVCLSTPIDRGRGFNIDNPFCIDCGDMLEIPNESFMKQENIFGNIWYIKYE